MKIYKIIKPGTNEVYIGQTKLSLKLRLQYHFGQQKIKPNVEVYKWLDETCIIELLEEFESDKKNLIKEMNWIQQFISLSFVIKNTYLGNYTLDPKAYIKSKNKKWNAKNNVKNNIKFSTLYKANGKQKQLNDKFSTLYKANGKQKQLNDKTNSNKHPEYNKWRSNIIRKAKKEDLSFKEYRIKYNIPDYDGPKKIN